MLAGLPGRTRTIDVHGVSTAVIELGSSGPGLLLLHGGIEGVPRRGRRCSPGWRRHVPLFVVPRRARARRVGATSRASTSDTFGAVAHRRRRAHTGLGRLDGRRALADRQPSRPASPLWRRPAAIERLVVCGAPGGRARTGCPGASRYVADPVRDPPQRARTPSASTASRCSTSTRPVRRDPGRFDGVRRVHTWRGPRATPREEDDARADQAHEAKADARRPSSARIAVPDHAVAGPPRPDGPARDRRGRRAPRHGWPLHVDRRCCARTRRSSSPTHLRTHSRPSYLSLELQCQASTPRPRRTTSRVFDAWSVIAVMVSTRQSPAASPLHRGTLQVAELLHAPTGLPFARSARAGDGPVSKRLRVAPVRGRSEPPGVRAILRPNRRSWNRSTRSHSTRSHSTRSHSTRNRRTRSRCCPVRCSTRSVTRAAEKSSDHVADAIERVIHQVERAVHHVPRDVDHGRRRRSRRRQRHRHGQRRRDDRRDRRCGRVRGGGGQGVRRGQLSWGRTGCHRCGRGGWQSPGWSSLARWSVESPAPRHSSREGSR